MTFKILAIDDNPQFLDLVRGSFRRDGDVSLSQATTGQDGMRLAMEQQYDTIICDYYLGDTTGAEVFRHLQLMGDRTPFILFTSLASEKRHEFYGENFLGIVSKFTPSRLRDLVLEVKSKHPAS